MEFDLQSGKLSWVVRLEDLAPFILRLSYDLSKEGLCLLSDKRIVVKVNIF
jgi:hypothetical protein